MAFDFQTIQAVVLDMDGVLWRGSEILPGVTEFFQFVRERGIPYAMATNNSTKTPEMYVERLNSLGIPIGPDQIITSSVATGDYMRRTYDPATTPLFIIGQEGIRREMSTLGFREDPDNASVVIVGLDFDINYDKLATAALRINAGATFIGTNGDLTFPWPQGQVPGNGSFLATLEAATGVSPINIGKPEVAMFEVAVERLGAQPAHTLMIGDRLETDILGGQRAGLHTALVLTGITSPQMAREAEIQADVVFDSLAALHHAWFEEA